MWSKVIGIVLNWILASIVLPIVSFVVDYFRLKKIEKDAKKAAQELKNAKTKDEIESAIDHLP